MKKTILLFTVFCFSFFPALLAYTSFQSKDPGWKAGVAKVNITPAKSMWMRGYGSRNRPSEGTLHDLWAKAMAFEDASGNRAVLITLDLCMMQKSFSDAIRKKLQKKYKLGLSQIILSFSHTHSGPTIRGEGEHHYKHLTANQRQDIERYSDTLEDQLNKIVGKALTSMAPVHLSSGNGVARFGVNRRNNNEKTLNLAAELEGPVDHAVPVIKVTTAKDNKLLAVVFGYACHATVLNTYKWSSDYPGLAQAALEEALPGTTAMFFAGSGADINPLPRRTVSLAVQYGNSLAAAVKRVLNEPMRELQADLVTTYSEIELAYAAVPAKSNSNAARTDPVTGTYPYPIQVWRIGAQNLVALGGEVVVDYTIRLKEIFGQDLFVMAYANAVMGYVPSTRILREGGYEGTKALNAHDGPTVWKADIENVIVREVLKLAEQAKVLQAESGLIEN
jgi:neutral ceramidase